MVLKEEIIQVRLLDEELSEGPSKSLYLVAVRACS